MIYQAKISDLSQVYDGDTIKGVRILLHGSLTQREEVWPGIFIEPAVVEIFRDIRIAGIDTPEKRPRKAGRTEQSRVNEKFAAKKSREVLITILENYDYQLELQNVQHGKYAGRVIASCFVGVGTYKESVAQLMIGARVAVPYDGGTKVVVDWDARVDGYMVG